MKCPKLVKNNCDAVKQHFEVFITLWPSMTLKWRLKKYPPFLLPWFSDLRVAAHRASYLCGRQSCRPPACERWCSDPADELLSGCSTEEEEEEEEDSKLSLKHRWIIGRRASSLDATWMDPRRRESRFLQTGSRISMQLKLRQAAGALAQDRACWGDQKHVTPGQNVTRK